MTDIIMIVFMFTDEENRLREVKLLTMFLKLNNQ